MEPTSQSEQPGDLTIDACPVFPEAIDVEQRLERNEAINLAKRCLQIGRNQREVSGRTTFIVLMSLFAIPVYLMISDGLNTLDAVRAGAAVRISLVLWCTSFLVPAASILFIFTILFSMRIKRTDADPPFERTTRIHLDKDWYEVDWEAQSGRKVSLMASWSQSQIRWSDNAWLIRPPELRRQFLIKRESLSHSQQEQFQQFALEVSDWKRDHPNHVRNEVTFPAINETGITYVVRVEHEPELNSLIPTLETFGMTERPLLFRYRWLPVLWIAVLCVSALTFPVYSLLYLNQGIGLAWMFSMIPIWLLYKLYRGSKQTANPDFQLQGLITPTGIWTLTPEIRHHHSFSGLQDCYRLDQALLLSWGKINEVLVILKSSFASEDDWQAACRQVGSVTSVRSL